MQLDFSYNIKYNRSTWLLSFEFIYGHAILLLHILELIHSHRLLFAAHILDYIGIVHKDLACRLQESVDRYMATAITLCRVEQCWVIAYFSRTRVAPVLTDFQTRVTTSTSLSTQTIEETCYILDGHKAATHYLVAWQEREITDCSWCSAEEVNCLCSVLLDSATGWGVPPGDKSRPSHMEAMTRIFFFFLHSCF